MLGGPLPPVPAEGNGGSGEIQALGHLFGSVPARLRLEVKEPMALINGSPCASALVADVAVRCVGAIHLAERVLALAADALQAPHEHFAAALDAMWDDVDEIVALATVRSLLRGADPRRRAKQALVSVRVIPKVLAAAYRARAGASLVAGTSLSSVNDNPIFVPPSPAQPAAVLSNGSFHNQHAIVAIDGWTRAAADLCQLAHALVQGIYGDRIALPGQDNLGVGTLYMPSSAWAEEARATATPSVLPAAAIGQNDVPNPVFTAWNRSIRTERCLHATLAILATLASQSFAVTERRTSPALQPLLTAIRDELPPVSRRRDLGPELDALATAFADRANHESAAPCPELARP
jgi:histidine ammonia-lyase